MKLRPFHLAVAVTDIKLAREFYGDLLGLEEGRSSDKWVDYNFWGHQFVVHLADEASKEIVNRVDGKSVPVPHFGVVLERNDWDQLAEKLKQANIQFIIEPYIRFEGEDGEQATMFFKDPFGNALEFKSMKNDDYLFKA